MHVLVDAHHVQSRRHHKKRTTYSTQNLRQTLWVGHPPISTVFSLMTSRRRKRRLKLCMRGEPWGWAIHSSPLGENDSCLAKKRRTRNCTDGRGDKYIMVGRANCLIHRGETARRRSGVHVPSAVPRHPFATPSQFRKVRRISNAWVARAGHRRIGMIITWRTTKTQITHPGR